MGPVVMGKRRVEGRVEGVMKGEWKEGIEGGKKDFGEEEGGGREERRKREGRERKMESCEEREGREEGMGKVGGD